MAVRSTPVPLAAGGTVSTLAPPASQARCAASGAASVVTTRVGASSGSNSGPSAGTRPVASSTTRNGGTATGGSMSRTVRRGWSASAVPGADDDRLGIGAQSVGVGARCGAGDPLRRAVARGDATVEAHRRLHDRERAAEPAVLQVGRERACGRVGADADVDGDTEVAQLGDPLPCDLGVGILERDHDPGDARLRRAR